MSILKTTHAGSKAIPVTCEQTILDEIAKLGYTYNYTLRCWSCKINTLPDILISHLYSDNPFYIYVDFSTHRTTTYHIKTMHDLFNFIEDMKNNYVNS
jgi:hypothetical protein